MAGRPEVGPVREGLLLAGATMALTLFGAVVPHLFVLAPVPLGVLTYRYGLRAGILAAVVTAAAQGRMINVLASLVAFLALGLGLALGGALREGYSAGRVFVGGLMVNLLSICLFLALSHFAFHVNLPEVVTASWQHGVEQAIAMWERTGLTPEEIEQQKRVLAANLERLRQIYPGLLVISAMLITAVDFWLIRTILGRMGEKVSNFSPFRLWRFPWPLALGFIFGRALVLAEPWTGSRWVAILGANLELVASTLFIVQGLAVAWHHFDRRGIGKLRYLLALLLLQFHWVPLLGGLFDVWFDFRGIGSASERAGGRRL